MIITINIIQIHINYSSHLTLSPTEVPQNHRKTQFAPIFHPRNSIATPYTAMGHKTSGSRRRNAAESPHISASDASFASKAPEKPQNTAKNHQKNTRSTSLVPALVMLWHIASIPVFTAFSLMLIAMFPKTWYLLVPYLVYLFWDRSYENGNVWRRRSDTVRGSRLWVWFAQYFPITLHKTATLSPENHYIFCYHPHGIGAMGAMGTIGTEGTGWSRFFPGIAVSLLTLSSQFYIPFHRDYILSLGISSIVKQNIVSLLKRQSVCIVIGGARESLFSQPNSAKLVLKNRKGFIKLALQSENTMLVPMYGFGENDVYDVHVPAHSSRLKRFQLGVKNAFGFTIPFFHARGLFNYDYGFLPYRKPIDVVVGSPITVPNIRHPSQEEVDKYHSIYVEALTKLYDENKGRYNQSAELEIV